MNHCTDFIAYVCVCVCVCVCVYIMSGWGFVSPFHCDLSIGNLLLLLLLSSSSSSSSFDCKWVVNPVAAVTQYGTTNNRQTNTHNNNKWYISHKTTQLLGQFTETEPKTAHTINWITTRNEYNHNCINIEISCWPIHWGVPVTGYVMYGILPAFNPNLLPNTSLRFTSLHFTSMIHLLLHLIYLFPNPFPTLSLTFPKGYSLAIT
jgi:hypothetical protein